jgi:diphthine synthase
MLALVGLGVNGINSINLCGMEVFKKSDVIYLDGYTTPITTNFVKALSLQIGKEVTVLKRAELEDGIEGILSQAKIMNVSLAVLGDPLLATTHMNLVIESKKRDVIYKVVHNTSVVSLLTSSCGLHPYKFGRIATIVRESGTPATSVYFTLYDNLIRGTHTIFLLEFDTESGEGVLPASAFKILENAEKVYKLDAFSEDTFLIVACRIERDDQKYYAGTVSDLKGIDFGDPPYSIVIPSRLHFTEEETIQVLYDIGKEKVNDNTKNLKKRVDYLVNKYVNKTRETLREAKEEISNRKSQDLDELFENVECYLDDSIRFLNSGEEHLAMLSVGYAEGLLDALRFQKVLDLKW